MKTTLKFLSAGLMIFALALTSCTKDAVQGATGPVGPQGEQGITGSPGEDGEALGVPGPAGNNGANGTNGTNGTNGEDGNANVIATSWTAANFGSTWQPFFAGKPYAKIDITDSRITQEVLDSYALLGYMKPSTNSTIRVIPFDLSTLTDISFDNTMELGIYSLYALKNSEIAGDTPPSGWNVRYVLIEASSTSGKNSRNSLDKMIASGVDTTNYEEVMDYLGLEY